MKDNENKKDKVTIVYLIEKYAFIRYILAIIFGIIGSAWIILLNEILMFIIQE